MPNFNSVHLVGRLVNDPEVKQFDNGNSVAKFSLAVSHIYLDNEKQKQEETSFFDCEVFGKRGEALAKYSSKGKHLLIDGRLKQDRWEDKESGQKRSKVLVTVESFEFLDSGGKRNEDDANAEDSKATERKAPANTRKTKIPF